MSFKKYSFSRKENIANIDVIFVNEFDNELVLLGDAGDFSKFVL